MREVEDVDDQQNCTHVVLNLEDVDRVTSQPLSRLLARRDHILQQGGQLKLCCLTALVAEMLERTQLDKVFDIAESEAAAVSSF